MNANFICLEIRIFDDKKGKIRKINVIKACERKLNPYLQKGSSSFFQIFRNFIWLIHKLKLGTMTKSKYQKKDYGLGKKSFYSYFSYFFFTEHIDIF